MEQKPYKYEKNSTLVWLTVAATKGMPIHSSKNGSDGHK